MGILWEMCEVLMAKKKIPKLTDEEYETYLKDLLKKQKPSPM